MAAPAPDRGSLADPRTTRRKRARAQLLYRPGPAGAADVAEHLLAIQAQNLRAARLAIRARAPALTAADVDAALEDRSLVVSWLCRTTLQLVRAEDHPWLHGLTATIGAAQGRRRLGQEGVSAADAERAVTSIEDALAGGPMTRSELAEPVAAAGIRTEGQAMPHLLALAARRGLIVRGPIRGDDQAFVLTRDWLGTDPPGELSGEERERALAELARRYLRAHGPATPADLCGWTGIGLRDARAGLAGIAAELDELDGLVDLSGRGEPGPEVPPRLLGGFDPYLLGWRDRSFAVPPEHSKRVHSGGGMIRAVATVDGLAVGTWKGAGAGVEIDRFDGGDTAEFEVELADVARFEA